MIKSIVNEVYEMIENKNLSFEQVHKKLHCDSIQNCYSYIPFIKIIFEYFGIQFYKLLQNVKQEKERVGPEAKPYVKVQKARKNEVQ